MKEQQEFIISAFPGIGPLMARNLLNYFGSIKNVVNASKSELVVLEGIGEKTADKLVEMFEEKYAS